MTRKLMTLGLAVVAILASTAVAAPFASAADEHEFVATAVPVVLTTDESTHTFEAKGVRVVCEVFFDGTLTKKTVDTVRVRPTYPKECMMEEIEVEVNNDGCEFVLDSDTTETPQHLVGKHARLDLDCNHEGDIEINSSLCSVSISDTHESGGAINQGLDGITYEVEGEDPVEFVVVNATVPTIKYATEGPFCELLGLPATGTDGYYLGISAVKGWGDVGNGEVPYNDNNVEIGLKIETLE